MARKSIIGIVESLSIDETRQVREAYRNFLENFDCSLCPTLSEVGSPNDLYQMVMDKQNSDLPCLLCHGFPSLLPDHKDGCPCLVLENKEEAHKRLVALVASWE